MTTREIYRKKSLGDKVIAFINKLPDTDDPQGRSITLDPWQEQFIRDIFEPRDKLTDAMLIREAILSVARKNGKSFIVAGLILAYLIGPLSKPNSQIYSVALNLEQAKVIFDMCVAMLFMRPALLAHVKITGRKKNPLIEVVNPALRSFGSKYVALTSTVGSKHGLNADFFVYDELGEAPNAEMWHVLYDSQQTKPDPLAVAISTQNNNPNQILTKMIDAEPADHRLVRVYSAPDECDLLDRSAWLAANPCLATWKRESSILPAALNAISDPSFEANFRQRYLNQRVQADTQFFRQYHLKKVAPATKPETASEAVQFEPDEPIYVGLDVSKRTDLTAIVAISTRTGLVKSWFLKPDSLIAKHAAKDDEPYVDFRDKGWLIGSTGETIGGDEIAKVIHDLYQSYDVQGLVYDFNHADDVIKSLRVDHGLTVDKDRSADLRGIKWGNGGNDAAKAVNALEDHIKNGKLTLDGNPLMAMCLAYAVVETDAMDRRKLVKGKATKRIDGAVALSIALALMVADNLEEKPEIIDWSSYSMSGSFT